MGGLEISHDITYGISERLLLGVWLVVFEFPQELLFAGLVLPVESPGLIVRNLPVESRVSIVRRTCRAYDCLQGVSVSYKVRGDLLPDLIWDCVEG